MAQDAQKDFHRIVAMSTNQINHGGESSVDSNQTEDDDGYANTDLSKQSRNFFSLRNKNEKKNKPSMVLNGGNIEVSIEVLLVIVLMFTVNMLISFCVSISTLPYFAKPLFHSRIGNQSFKRAVSGALLRTKKDRKYFKVLRIFLY